MKERPIMFKAEMVRAILSGEKTQTRRPVKATVRGARVGTYSDGVDHGDGSIALEFVNVGEDGSPIDGPEFRCPYGVPGDRLWVRETWKDSFKRTPENNGCVYLADYGYRLDLVSNEQARLNWKWRSAMFMPRWASRITLEVVDVRVERVQSITEEDAIAEGVDTVSLADVPRQATMSRRGDFAQLWDRLYVKTGQSWAKNPWVWVVEFRRVNEAREETTR